MKKNNMVYFTMSGERILDMLKQITDLPKDAELIRIKEAPLYGYRLNNINFYITAEEFDRVMPGDVIPLIRPELDIDE